MHQLSYLQSSATTWYYSKKAKWLYGVGQNADEKVAITTSWNNKTINVTADPNGKWFTYLNTTKAGGPYTIIFRGTNQLQVDNVLLGEVWLA